MGLWNRLFGSKGEDVTITEVTMGSSVKATFDSGIEAKLAGSKPTETSPIETTFSDGTKGSVSFRGKKLTSDFKGAIKAANVAVSNDGSKYAIVTEKGVEYGKMPANGIAEVDGMKITYGVGNNIRNNSICISGGKNISTTQLNNRRLTVENGGPLEWKIDESYAGVGKVKVDNSFGDISLAVSDDDKVYVKGKTKEEPKYKGNKLKVEELNGTVSIPKGVGIKVDSSSGKVYGEVAGPGKIDVSFGDIDLVIKAPLRVKVDTSFGNVDVRGMLADGENTYKSPDAEPIGTLKIDTSSGNVKIRYKN